MEMEDDFEDAGFEDPSDGYIIDDDDI